MVNGGANFPAEPRFFFDRFRFKDHRQIFLDDPVNYSPGRKMPQMPNPGFFPFDPCPEQCYPPNFWFPFPSFHQNLPDSNVGDRGHLWWKHSLKGYGIDLDGDGRYTRGKDGVLAFDFNRDGKLDDREISRSNNMLKAFGGNYDFDGDGKVSWWERKRGEALKREASRYDLNKDGVFDANELERANAKVWIDQNRDGRADRNETYSSSSFPTPWFGNGSIGYVDPRNNYTQVWNYYPWFPPYVPPYPSYPTPDYHTFLLQGTGGMRS